MLSTNVKRSGILYEGREMTGILPFWDCVWPIPLLETMRTLSRLKGGTEKSEVQVGEFRSENLEI